MSIYRRGCKQCLQHIGKWHTFVNLRASAIIKIGIHRLINVVYMLFYPTYFSREIGTK